MVEIHVCGLDEHITYALDFVGLISLAQPCLNWSLMRSPVYAGPTAVSHHRVPDRDVVLALLHELRQSRIFRRRMLSLYADTPLVISVGNWSAPRFCTGVWSSLVLQLIYRHAQASLMMSWLSTLGGAFSSLGDTDSKSAQMAGRISFHQFCLSRRVHNRSFSVQCILFATISCIQRCMYRRATRLVSWAATHTETHRDYRLSNMYNAIMQKLRYERELNKQARNLSHRSVVR